MRPAVEREWQYSIKTLAVPGIWRGKRSHRHIVWMRAYTAACALAGTRP